MSTVAADVSCSCDMQPANSKETASSIGAPDPSPVRFETEVSITGLLAHHWRGHAYLSEHYEACCACSVHHGESAWRSLICSHHLREHSADQSFVRARP